MRYATAIAKDAQSKTALLTETKERTKAPPTPERIQAVGRHEVPIETVVPWSDNPAKRSQIPDARLEASIREIGILSPLEVIRHSDDGGQWLCIDGNRRYRIARRLGMTHVPIIELPGTPEEIALVLNTTGDRWDTQTQAQFIAAHPDALPFLRERVRLTIQRAQDFMGKDYEEWVSKNTLSAIESAQRLASYMGRSMDKQYIKKLAFWIARHRQTARVSVAILMQMSTKRIERAIEDDAPLAVVR